MLFSTCLYLVACFALCQKLGVQQTNSIGKYTALEVYTDFLVSCPSIIDVMLFHSTGVQADCW